MNCTRCGAEIDGESAFCRHCGAALRTSTQPKRLVRLPAQGRIGGVCAGIADYLDTDVTAVRLIWVVLSIVPGALIGGILAYLAAWMLMPQANVPVASAPRLTRSATDRKIAGVCGGIAEYLAVDPTVIRLLWVILTVVPGAIVLGVVAYFVAWFIVPDSRATGIVPATQSI
jgi:phage shock protein PspC (stress-responsive transcriptional regulator)